VRRVRWSRRRQSQGADGEYSTHRVLTLVPAPTIERVARELRRKGPRPRSCPSGLGSSDPLVSQLMLSLERCVSRIRARSLCSDCRRDVGRPSLVRYGRYGEPPTAMRATAGCAGRRLHARESRVRSESGGSGAGGGVSRFHLPEIVTRSCMADPLSV